ncbi:hypothetical protein RG47T_0501 [Mucilaginibacter polytrichastri]|uniref:CCDC81-like prokaryotic HU domain-containing protein n=3 Tax=Mucilaginibacter polytrichastri TaxID=1302689 RepID=A0A1Q5ZTG9_9SPHI|nr:hypothetical protein RG47T_0501 [Mucilaginibacter polytrichastri]
MQATVLPTDMGMDLANYVSQLLQQHGHLNVPGLGYFAHLRKSSYYDKGTGTIYPPYYEVSFEAPRDVDNDSLLLGYIAEKRNIATDTAQYLIERFAGTVKEQAAEGEVDFGDLGSFYIDANSQLAFRANKAGVTFSSPLYGLPPVKIKKLEDLNQPVEQQPEEPAIIPVEAVTPEPVAPALPAPPQETYITPAVIEEQPLPAVAEEDIEEQPKSKAVYWIVFAVIVIALVAGFLVYQYKVLNKNNTTVVVKPQQKITPVKADTDTVKKDTLAIAPATVKADSAIRSTGRPSANNAPIGEIPKNTWLILGGSFNNYVNATRAVTNYRTLGHPEARLLDSVQRKSFFVYKIVFGYRYTKKQADSVRLEILKPRTIKSKFIFVEPYK